MRFKMHNKQIDVDMRRHTAMKSTQKQALWPETAQEKRNICVVVRQQIMRSVIHCVKENRKIQHRASTDVALLAFKGINAILHRWHLIAYWIGLWIFNRKLWFVSTKGLFFLNQHSNVTIQTSSSISGSVTRSRLKILSIIPFTRNEAQGQSRSLMETFAHSLSNVLHGQCD